MKRILVAAIFVLASSLVARAEPALQLYVEGSTYDSGTESWVIPGNSFTLWVIGNTGWKGTIYDVKLSIAFDSGETVAVSFTPSTTGGLGGFTDPSTPSSPTFVKTVTDGSAPLLGDGSSLPTHGIYGAGVSWHEYALGDLNLVDSPIGDFITSFPSPSSGNKAQINVYDVTVSGATSGVHIDLYNHVEGSNHVYYKFAPFSHDADGTGGGGIPEPALVLLAGLGLAGVLARRRRRARSR